MRIMVVEDDNFLRASLVEALEDEDYEVVEAADASQALALAGRETVDLVVTDVRLGAVDGLELLARMRTLQPRARSIVMTGYASDEAPGRAVRVQAEDYLYKPFSLDDFLDAVERVFASGQEAERYEGLLGGFFRKLADAAAARLTQAELSAVQGPRDEAFKAFFVGVRSRQLDEAGGRLVWSHLEELERRRQELLRGATLGQGKQLAEGYRYVSDLVAAFSRSSLGALSTGGSLIEEVAFRFLFGQIRSGAVSLEQVKQAPTMRGMDRLTLSQSEPLAALRSALWGSPSG